VHARWSTISPYITVQSYYLFYQRRYMALKQKRPQKKQPDPLLLENCENWEFLCPVTLDKLQRTSDRTVDYCTVCKENVYLVENMKDLQKRAKAKQCVAIDFDGAETDRRTPSVNFRGKIAVGRFW